jgi:Mrp family chromosome partitioning ATPase
MGRLKDGVALVIEAHRTRRVKAQKAKEILQAANLKVLGTVLSERTFPIPEAIYRNL